MNTSHQTQRTQSLVRIALVTAIYVVMTLALPSFTPLQFRLSEGLNYLALYDKRYIYAVTLGVFIANYQMYGPVDMVVGSLSTLVFLTIGRWLARLIVAFLQKKGWLKVDGMWVQYAVLAMLFSLSMFTIAFMYVTIVDATAAFWPIYGQYFLSEIVVLTLTAFPMYKLGQHLKLSEH